MGYKKYERYKDSGVEWIGKIPEGWNIIKCKRLFSIVNGSTPQTNIEDYWDGDIVWLTPVDLSLSTNPYIEESLRKITREGLMNCSAKIVPEGSLVLSTRAPIGYVRIAAKKLCTNQGCKTLVPQKKLNSRYYYYHILGINSYIKSLGQGTTFTELSNAALSNILFSLPYIHEQTAIANFLDQKTAEIDSLIADKEKMIQLLQEKRQAIISEAVTKGLDRNVPMKDSGVEWIGEIPAHWSLYKITWIFNLISSGATPSSINLEYYDGNIPWVNTGDLNDGYIYDTPKTVTEIALRECSALKLFPVDTLLIAMYGATIGKLGITKIIASTNQACCALAGPKNAIIKFIFYWFLANRSNIISMAYGGGQPNISQNLIKSLRIPLPEIEEQKSIVNFLDQKTSEIDALISDIQTQIDKLKEYRQSLISEAVTGKIDVREFTPSKEGVAVNA
ncbi:MAG: type restriction enzyme subunit [Thermosediminibacterales bacterium]|nr:type restriction enzyme subunit [Thermosediminibacterales bacterium]